MAPLRDYLCSYCGHEFTELVYSSDPDEYATAECRCGSKGQVLPSSISGVTGVPLSGAKPKNRTAKKAFTGHPGNDGEPKTQLEFKFGAMPEIPEDKEYD